MVYFNKETFYFWHFFNNRQNYEPKRWSESEYYFSLLMIVTSPLSPLLFGFGLPLALGLVELDACLRTWTLRLGHKFSPTC